TGEENAAEIALALRRNHCYYDILRSFLYHIPTLCHEISALQTCGRRPLSKFTLRGGPAGRITQKRRSDEAVPWQHIHHPTPSPTARTKTNKYPSLLQSVL